MVRCLLSLPVFFNFLEILLRENFIRHPISWSANQVLSCDTTFFQVQVTLGAWDDLLRECRAKLINILCIFTYFSAVGLRGSGLLTIDIHPAWDKGHPLKPLNRACLEQEIPREISLVIDYPRIPPLYNLLHIHPGQCQSGNHHYLMEKAYNWHTPTLPYPICSKMHMRMDTLWNHHLMQYQYSFLT